MNELKTSNKDSPEGAAMYRVAKLLSLISTGFLAGVFTYAFFAIIPAWNEVPREVHFTYRVALMRHNAIVMQSIMAVGIIAPLWWAWTIRAMPAARACAVAASVMNLTAVVVTRFGNVPINQYVRKWLTETPPMDYLEILHRWTVFNNIRSVAAVLGFALILIADALLD
jgi:uncharacterized membrane protein